MPAQLTVHQSQGQGFDSYRGLRVMNIDNEFKHELCLTFSSGLSLLVHKNRTSMNTFIHQNLIFTLCAAYVRDTHDTFSVRVREGIFAV